jgi:hypothetical protein
MRKLKHQLDLANKKLDKQVKGLELEKQAAGFVLELAEESGRESLFDIVWCHLELTQYPTIYPSRSSSSSCRCTGEHLEHPRYQARTFRRHRTYSPTRPDSPGFECAAGRSRAQDLGTRSSGVPQLGRFWRCWVWVWAEYGWGG